MRRVFAFVAFVALAGCERPEIELDLAEPTPEPAPEAAVAPIAMRRLLTRQYVNAIEHLLGPEAAAAASPAADLKSNQMEAIGAQDLATSADAIWQYEYSARNIAIAARAAGSFDRHLACEPASADDAACMRSYVTAFGYLAFRRPLTVEEITRWTAVGVDAATADGSFEDGLEWVTAGMLQSPSFLYQVELGEPGPGARRKLSRYELATRLSFFLNDATPDALFNQAAHGQLDTAAGVRGVAAGLLERPEARAALRAYYGEIYGVRELDTSLKYETAFPAYDEALAAAMQESAYLLLDEVVWERNADWTELLDADYAFVDAQLADLYGIGPFDKRPTQNGSFVRVHLPDEHDRSGILTQASTMSWLAHPNSTSPTKRGKWVQERLLCRTILPPPPEVNTVLPVIDPNVPMTMRERLEEHQTNPTCAGCHVQMDNIGFALEHFDGIGRWRETDMGLPIDDSGEIAGITTFDGPRGLATALKADSRLDECFVRTLYSHAFGRVPVEADEPMIDSLTFAFRSNGGSVEGLLLDLVSSDAFRYVGKPDGLLPGTHAGTTVGVAE